ncbi:MAG: hypothetical protein RQ806_03455 [Erythrobacter sp.]|nr:DUF4345 family protein [Alphaproteobacteria bacterium]MDT8279587.1 hypothetical protein [Erythrobacter sp.]
MIFALRIALALLGVLFVSMSFGFLTNPGTAGGDFGITALGPQGMASIRADLTAFFAVAGGAFLLGAWKRNGGALLVAAALMAIAFAGRSISVVFDGTYDGWFVPMGVEAVSVILALIGSRVLPEKIKPSP